MTAALLRHSRRVVAELSDVLSVVTVPVLQDNYSYLVFNALTRDAISIDPGGACLFVAPAVLLFSSRSLKSASIEAEPVAIAAKELGLNLKNVLCTHHHE